MAGTIIADYIRTDANKLSLNVGNTTFATINAGGFYSNTGTQIIAANGTVSTTALSGTIAAAQIASNAVTAAKMGYPGAVVNSAVSYIPQGTGSNASTETEIYSTTFTKLYSNTVSKVRIRFHWTFNFGGVTNGDHDVALFLRNTTASSYLGYRTNTYGTGAGNSFYSHDTVNQYLNIVSGSYFVYHQFGHTMVCEDPYANAGVNTYSLRLKQDATTITTYVCNNWSPYASITFEEILL